VPPEANRLIRQIAAERGCEVDSVEEVFGSRVDACPETNLEGSFQRFNAATAVLAVRRLTGRFPVPGEHIRLALMEVNWPGRWQRMAVAGREMIFDAAHNPEGAECLEENLAKWVAGSGRRPHVVLGVLGAPRAAAIVPVVARHARSLHLVVVPHQPRSCAIDELRSFVPRGFAGEVLDASVSALFPAPGVCRVGSEGEPVLVTGSIYLLGEVMDRLLHDPPRDQGRLQD
jgi:dihydrofolate synthase/folylpolyglutamate synthase